MSYIFLLPTDGEIHFFDQTSTMINLHFRRTRKERGIHIASSPALADFDFIWVVVYSLVTSY